MPGAEALEPDVNPQLYLAFLVVAVALACTPGVDWAYSIAAGLRQRNFAPAVAGLCGGYLVHTALLVFGLAALLTGAPGVLGWLTAAGAVYLLWLGFSTVRTWRGASFGAGTSGVPAAASASQARIFLQGMGISGINPKGLLFFVALMPQFVSSDATLPVPVQSGLLGLTFVLLAAVIYSCVALLSRRLLHARPGAARRVTLASGIIMLLLGVALLAEQLIPVIFSAAAAHG